MDQPAVVSMDTGGLCVQVQALLYIILYIYIYIYIYIYTYQPYSYIVIPVLPSIQIHPYNMCSFMELGALILIMNSCIDYSQNPIVLVLFVDRLS